MLPGSTKSSLSPSRKYLLFIALLLWAGEVSGQTGRAMQLQQLSAAISHADRYDALKQQRIDSIKHLLARVRPDDLSGRFGLYKNLYEEYRLFQFDSSYHYARKLRETALQLNDTARLMYAKIKLGFSLLSSGM